MSEAILNKLVVQPDRVTETLIEFIRLLGFEIVANKAAAIHENNVNNDAA